MSKALSFVSAVVLAVAEPCVVACSQGASESPGSNSPDASQSVGVSGAGGGGTTSSSGEGAGSTAGGSTGGVGTGSGVSSTTGPGGGSGSVGGATGGAVGSSGSEGTATLLPPAGTCPTGFVVCDGVCMEASLMGANCRPAACPAPPAATTAPTRTTLSARGFTWSVATDPTGTTTVTFKPGPGGGGNAPTVGADINYRVNGVPALQTATLTSQGGAFTWTTQSLKSGDDLDFYFHQTVATQTIITGGGAPPATQPLIDTMWFHQTIGQAADPEPAYPLTATLAGRFRDRHPNEERFDHFVDTYFDGPIFSINLVDYGNYLRITITPVDTHVFGVDFKTYECFGAGQREALDDATGRRLAASRPRPFVRAAPRFRGHLREAARAHEQ